MALSDDKIKINIIRNRQFVWNNPEKDKNFLMKHIRLRFKELAFILENYTDVNVIFEGINYSMSGWGFSFDYETSETRTFINSLLTNFIKHFNTNEVKRVSYGSVGNVEKEYHRQYKEQHLQGKASRELIHVWKATPDNYNLENETPITHTERKVSEYNEIKKQENGVFGIVTIYTSKDIPREFSKGSNYLKSYYPELLKLFES